jgi:hypothetical protein
MKAITVKTIEWLTVLISVYASFLVIGFALLGLPTGMQAIRNSSFLDGMWLILLSAIMLGMYYFIVWHLVGKRRIAAV